MISKPLWLPEIVALEDFVILKSRLSIPDQLTLLVKLYRVHQSIEGFKAKPFTEFISWGNILLADFDEIDQYLVDGEAVYEYLDEIKAMNLWNPDGSPLTDFERKYLLFYNSLSTIYSQFRKELLEAKQGYFGLAFSQLIENLDAESFGEWDKIVFAGFNALTIAEEKLISELISKGKGEVYWDVDEYYLTDARQEAGRFLRNYLKDKKFGEMKWIGNSLKTNQKDITIVGVPGNIGQAKVAGQITSELIKNIDPSEIAIVLVDEGLMLPVLNSVPSELEHFNVTMGFPIKLTPVFSLFDSIFKLFLHGQKAGQKSGSGTREEVTNMRFHYKDIKRFIDHPYMEEISAKAIERSGILNKEGRVFFSPEELRQIINDDTLPLSVILKELIMGNELKPRSMLTLMAELINFYRILFLERESRGDSSHSVDLEYLYTYSILIEKLESIIEETDLVADLETFHEIYTSQVSGTRLPFYGEPLKGLQLMGMLETRTLDFRNIIMLSVNEGLLPKGKHQNTFLTDELRREFGLQRYNERNAVFGYHFYRLLQRSDNIYLLYNTEGNEFGGGEKSRFITQIMYELPLYNPGIHIKETIFSIAPSGNPDLPVQINKNDETLKKILAIAEKGFSPTAIGRYLACSLQFYFAQVLGMKEPDLLEESIDAAAMGEIIHEVLHKVYLKFEGSELVKDNLDKMYQLAETSVRDEFLARYSLPELESGKNLLILKVAQNMVKQFLKAEGQFIEKLPAGKQKIKILCLEQSLESSIPIADQRTGEMFNVRIKGTADRIDLVDGTIRIIDYKTGLVKMQEVKINSIDELLKHDNPAKLVQLLTYAWLYRCSKDTAPISSVKLISGIISMRLSSRYLINATIGKIEEIDDQVLLTFESLLGRIISDIVDSEKPFVQTDNLDVCKNCAYQSICNRTIN
ncbi:MAG: PD-(D/E)XK nuclease family protein [Bacteroidetes bacterium]|nr:PD-(D/E)XK nuclease family protein [Bacteroidota bacterium]